MVLHPLQRIQAQTNRHRAHYTVHPLDAQDSDLPGLFMDVPGMRCMALSPGATMSNGAAAESFAFSSMRRRECSGIDEIPIPSV